MVLTRSASAKEAEAIAEHARRRALLDDLPRCRSALEAPAPLAFERPICLDEPLVEPTVSDPPAPAALGVVERPAGYWLGRLFRESRLRVDARRRRFGSGVLKAPAPDID